MGKELELLKEKLRTIIICEIRFNPNHAQNGRFTFGSGGASGGSGSSFTKANENTQAAHKNAIEKLNSSEYDDGTYDLDTFKSVNYDSGFQVTFCQIGDNYSNAEYADKVNEFLSASSDGKTLAGKFESTPEISFHVNDKSKAVALAKKYNQISIWDWKNCDEVKTGGTGRRK